MFSLRVSCVALLTAVAVVSCGTEEPGTVADSGGSSDVTSGGDTDVIDTSVDGESLDADAGADDTATGQDGEDGGGDDGGDTALDVETDVETDVLTDTVDTTDVADVDTADVADAPDSAEDGETTDVFDDSGDASDTTDTGEDVVVCEDDDLDTVCNEVDLCPGFDDRLDGDTDGIPSCLDLCPDDPLKSAPDVCGCGIADDESDDDTVYDCFDNCAELANADQRDSDGDREGDVCDVDSDTDGDGEVDADDCRPVDPTRNHLADELCNGADDDCDEEIDEDGACVDCALSTFDDARYLTCSPSLTFEAAHQFCNVRGYELVTLDSAAEADYVAALSASGGWWIGYSDRAVEGRFAWIDFSPFSLTRWFPGEPSNSDGDEDCVELLLPDGMWNDTSCAQTRPFFCEESCGGTDFDSDGTPDACDICRFDRDDDLDGDGVCGNVDPCPDVYREAGGDIDGDRILDACDDGDFDLDGVPDRRDFCPADGAKLAPGVCGCGESDASSDGDVLIDCLDRCPALNSTDNTDTDRDGVGDACDPLTDSDGDGVGDDADCAPSDQRRHGGVAETCNSRDDDCDPATTEFEACGCDAEFTSGGHVFRTCAGGTFAEARDLCTSMPGFDLASILSGDENDALALHATVERWIGLSDAEFEGNFIWVDGNPRLYTGWGTGEPNNTGNEDCVMFRPGGKWNDVLCGATALSFCGRRCEGLDWDADDLAGSCDPCELDPDNDLDGDGICGDIDRCPSVADNSNRDWNDDGFGDACDLDSDADGDLNADGTELCPYDPDKILPGACGCGHAEAAVCDTTCTHAVTGSYDVLVCTAELDWNAAAARCRGLDAELAAPADDAQIDALARISQRDLGGSGSFWLGYSDSATEGSWVSTWGEAMATTRWTDGEPNNDGEAPGEDCAEQLVWAGSWNDAGCASARPFICTR